jgi:uncharacterized protein YyaL (SSP411 family)
LSEKGKFNYAEKLRAFEMDQSRTNRLAKEKSPYLLKHKHNPVDWYPWGKEALAKAKNDNKPIFLSIGYSTCHWCTVMERESFEDPKTAAILNKNFIPIKVDREERPEIDAYYMNAVQAMTGGGGWPLSVFLTPDLKPFYGGTYYPPEPRYGMPGFVQVLEFVSNLWKDKREDVAANSQRVLEALADRTKVTTSMPGKGALDEGYSSIVSSFDPEWGGFGRSPKFPLPSTLSFLLRYHYRTGKELALNSVLKTLDAIAAGGIRDHLGGGFHRYSTDRVWLVPHFEKMLYDNVLLVKVYSEALQITKRALYEEVIRETLGWISREMTNSDGGFYSAQDADTEEGEGLYYTWTPEQTKKALGDKAAIFDKAYGITRTGNFEGRTILHTDIGLSTITEIGNDTKQTLYSERLRRPRPATDEKILTSWNGLAISAFSAASSVLGDSTYLRHAAGAADFILETNSKDGRLLRRFAGGQADYVGTLEDYAFFIQGLLDLFETSGEQRWLRESARLADIMMKDYEDKANGGFFLTVIPEPVRLKESYDGPTPSGNSVAALSLIRLSELTGRDEYRKGAERTLKYFGEELEQRPSSHTCMLAALDMLVSGMMEIVISSPNPKEAKQMLAEVRGRYLPNKALLVATRGNFEQLSKLSTLLDGREPRAKARAFVCENFACDLPADSAGALKAQLDARKG